MKSKFMYYGILGALVCAPQGYSKSLTLCIDPNLFSQDAVMTDKTTVFSRYPDSEADYTGRSLIRLRARVDIGFKYNVYITSRCDSLKGTLGIPAGFGTSNPFQGIQDEDAVAHCWCKILRPFSTPYFVGSMEVYEMDAQQCLQECPETCARNIISSGVPWQIIAQTISDRINAGSDIIDTVFQLDECPVGYTSIERQGVGFSNDQCIQIGGAYDLTLSPYSMSKVSSCLNLSSSAYPMVPCFSYYAKNYEGADSSGNYILTDYCNDMSE